MKRIILTADDYGVNDFIDNGILDAIEQGKINSVATMVTHPLNLPQRIDKLKKACLGKEIGIGLHTSITSGSSLLGTKSSLVTKKNEHGWQFKSAKKYRFKNVQLVELKQELLAQLEKMDELLGEIKIDSVSNHHGYTYIDMDFFQVYIEAIAEYSAKNPKYNMPIPIRSPMSWLKSKVAVYDADGKFSLPHVRRGLKLGNLKKIFELSMATLEQREQLAAKLNIRFPTLLADTIYGQPNKENIEFLLMQFENWNMTSEFMFHLGKGIVKDQPEYHGINPDYYKSRVKELNALSDLDIELLLQKYKVTKILFSDL